MATQLRLDSVYPDRLAVFQIDNRLYRLRTFWDDRLQGWYLSFGTQTEWLIQGERLQVNQPVIRRTSDLMPSGVFTCVDLDGQGEPGRDDLGGRVIITYTDEVFTADEDEAEAVSVEPV